MAKKCYAIGGRVNFNADTISLCHGMDIGDKIIWDIDCNEPFSPKYYKKKISILHNKNQEDIPECLGCSNLCEGNISGDKIEIVTINPMYYCQNRCIYCCNFRGDVKSKYNPLPIIKQFIAEEMIADNCLFDWGGGEPTISDIFEETFMYLLSEGYMQRVNTNAVKLSNIVLNNLNNNLVSLRISLDAGNYNAFLATKGRNLFRCVVDNIKEYKDKTDNLLLKYVITNTNSDEKSLSDFIELAKEINVKTICIDAELFSYGQEDYQGLLRFTEKELKAAHYLQNKAHEAGLNVQIGYVWTARDITTPSRDFNCISSIEKLIENDERYKIPESLSEFHINRIKEFEFGIVAKVMASFETLLVEVANKKIILYGAGNHGKELLAVLKKYGLEVDCFCDKYIEEGKIENIPIVSIESMLRKIDEDTVVIITPNIVKDILVEFNKNRYEILRGKLIYIDRFRFSSRVLDEIDMKEFERIVK